MRQMIIDIDSILIPKKIDYEKLDVYNKVEELKALYNDDLISKFEFNIFIKNMLKHDFQLIFLSKELNPILDEYVKTYDNINIKYIKDNVHISDYILNEDYIQNKDSYVLTGSQEVIDKSKDRLETIGFKCENNNYKLNCKYKINDLSDILDSLNKRKNKNILLKIKKLYDDNSFYLHEVIIRGNITEFDALFLDMLDKRKYAIDIYKQVFEQNEYLIKNLLSNMSCTEKDVCIVLVPGNGGIKTDDIIYNFSSILLSKYNFIDRRNSLLRINNIFPKIYNVTKRDKPGANSIIVKNKIEFEDKLVILIDDCNTSFEAYKYYQSLFKDLNIRKLKYFAIAKYTGEVRE